MSTLRVSNIEAKADVSSPSVNEKVKVTNSNGELLIHIDGATSGITTVGISTSGESFRFDSNQNVTFFGSVTGTGLDVNGNADISGNLNVGGVLTYEDVTNIDSVGVVTARSGIDVTGAANVAGTLIFQPGGTAWSTTNSRPQLGRQADGELRLGAGSDSSSIVTFYTSPSAGGTLAERLRITSDGQLVSTNGTLRRNVNDSSFALSGGTASNVGANIVVYGGSHSSLANVIRFRIGGTEKARITSNGDLMTGGITSGAGKVQVGGGLRIAGSATHTDTPSPYLYRTSGVDNLCISTSALERLRITSDGKFGFNDNNPERTIDVKGSNCMIQLEGTGGNGRQYSLCSSDDTTGNAVDGGPSGTFAIYDDTAGAARLRIDSSGNVTLGIAGNSLYFQNGFNNSTARIQNGGASNNSNLKFYTRTSGTEVERLRITSDGDLNSGNMTISAYSNTHNVGNYSVFLSDNHANTFFGQNLRLDFTGTSGNHQLKVINQHGTVGGAGMLIGGNGSSYVNQLKFFTVPANQSAGTRVDNTAYARMTIGYDGKFYYGTTSQGPHGGFFNIDASSSGRNGINVQGTTANYVMVSSAGGSSGDHIHFSNYSNNNQETGRIKDNQSNVTYYTSSDYRLKDNIIPIADGITRVKQLNPVRHTWINNPALGTVDGWIAHELDEVCPDAVDGEKDAVREDGSIKAQAADYGRITPLLAAGLKEAIAKIEALEDQYNALADRITALEP